METLRGKKIVLGITGSIAAYKACYLIRGLIKRGAEVQVVITPAGKEFITPVTLSALTSKPVVSEFFSGRDGSWHSHVALGLWADAMVIAQDGSRNSRQYAHHDLLVHESSRFRGSGNGFGHVRPSFHAAEPRTPP